MKRFQYTKLAIGFLAIGLTACPKSGTIPFVSIRPVESQLVVQRKPQGLAFEIGVVVANAGPGPVFLSDCSPALQRKMGTDWVTVWTPVCITFGAPQQVSAGDSAGVSVVGSAYTSPTSQPQLDPRFTSGTYRLLWSISYPDDATGPAKVVPSDRTISSEFGITISQDQ